MGLNSSYTAIRGNILMMIPFPSMSQVYSLLIQEERQRQVRNEQHFLSDTASFSAGTTKPSPIAKRPDHKRSPLFSEHCKKPGHTVEKCYKLHGYPNKPQGRGRGGYTQASSRRACNTWTEQTTQDTPANQEEQQTPVLPGLNSEQCKQLYQFLSNLTSTNTSKTNDSEMNTANTAGIFSSLTNAHDFKAICLSCQLIGDI